MAAIKSVATILADYDSDQQFPAFGFGAKSPQFGGVSHCFPLNFNPSAPEVIGVQVSKILTVSVDLYCVVLFVCVHGHICIVCLCVWYAYVGTVCSSVLCVCVCVCIYIKL